MMPALPIKFTNVLVCYVEMQCPQGCVYWTEMILAATGPTYCPFHMQEGRKGAGSVFAAYRPPPTDEYGFRLRFRTSAQPAEGADHRDFCHCPRGQEGLRWAREQKLALPALLAEMGACDVCEATTGLVRYHGRYDADGRYVIAAFGPTAPPIHDGYVPHRRLS